MNIFYPTLLTNKFSEHLIYYQNTTAKIDKWTSLFQSVSPSPVWKLQKKHASNPSDSPPPILIGRTATCMWY